MTRTRQHRGNGVRPLLCLSVLFVTCLHVYVGLDAQGPVVFEDEMGYLMGARFLAGQLDGARIGPMGSYSIGWSVALAPAAWLFDDPGRFYRASLVFGAFLGGITVVPIWWLLSELVLGTRRRLAVVVAAAAMCLPGFTLMAGYAYAESWLRFLFALCAAAAYCYWRRSGWWWGAALGALAAALYLSHGRFAGTMVLTALMLAAGLFRGDARRAGAGLLALAATLIAGSRLEPYIYDGLYELAYNRSDRLIRRVIDGPRSGQIVAFLGDLFYSTVTTYGTAAVGSALVLIAMSREWRGRRFEFYTWLAGAAGSVLVVVALQGGRAAATGTRLDYIGYGRYIDVVLPLFAAWGLGAALTMTGRRERLLAAFGPPVAAAIFIGGVLAIYGPDRLQGKPIAMLSAAGLAPWHDPQEHIYPWQASLVAAAVIGPALVLLPGRAWFKAALAVVVFAGLSLYGETRSMEPLDRPWQRFSRLDDQIAVIEPDVLWIDLGADHLYARNGYQFWASGAEVRFFDRAEGMPQPDGLVATGFNWPAGSAVGARRIGSEELFNQALWVLPGPLADELAAAGYLESAADQPLPESALAVGWSASEADDSVEVTLTHAGLGGPWLAIWDRATLDGGVGAVRLRVELIDGSGTKVASWERDLAETLFPGDHEVFTLRLPPDVVVSQGDTLELYLERVGQGEFGRETLRLDS